MFNSIKIIKLDVLSEQKLYNSNYNIQTLESDMETKHHDLCKHEVIIVHLAWVTSDIPYHLPLMRSR